MITIGGAIIVVDYLKRLLQPEIGIRQPQGKKLRFTKPATSFEEQVQLLKGRGMDIPDKKSAIHYLSHLNFYRLGAYWLPFESDHDTHQFRVYRGQVSYCTIWFAIVPWREALLISPKSLG